ncbi:MAG: hypothetical protein SP1CHLAM54_11510 [Chlamydiia bacterium]|nr:hypothetical protein [Chlamydiia bacterium]MCH9616054.1 hypothetical protein [Chlamydiia bacterium]MCH9629077.1 hypothetical protein [Chlamydiia bacterium]
METEKIAYLAAPYNDPDLMVRRKRYILASYVAYDLIKAGTYVFSPLTHNGPLMLHLGLTGWEVWGPYDLSMLKKCDSLIVIKMEGWEQSKGVSKEIEKAEEWGIPIEYIDPPKEKARLDLEHQHLVDQIVKLVNDRDWNQFHPPKSLAISLASEVGELLEHFAWVTDEESLELPEKTLKEVKDEMGDVFLNLLYLAHRLEIDLIDVTHKKLNKVAEKYPVEKAKGQRVKYTEL